MGSDGKTLLISADLENSIGGNDLWISVLQEDGTYSKPKNLGEFINTAGEEASPFLAADGKTLYFSSNGYTGYGSMDLYYTKRLDTTWLNWS